MLSVYTRHHPSCKNAGDKTWRRCNCPKWVWGSQNGQFIRQSAKTHSWEAAEELRRQLTAELTQPSRTTPEMPPNPILVAPTSMQPRVATRLLAEEITPVQPRKPRVTVENAVDAYLADARSRELESATLSKLETIFRKQFLVWSRIEGIEFLDQIDLDALLNFRNTWKDGKLAKQKKQSRLIGFFWACVRRGYIAQNPCMGLGKIKVVQIPTDYFPRDEFQRILDATHVYGDPRGGFIPIEDLRTRLRTMTLLMRWSGLRIRDAITFERHHLQGDSLLLYQAKTGTPVYVPLPPYVVEALDNVPPGPKPNPRYFFWSGNGDPKSAVANWQRSYRRLFELADIRKPDGEIKRCHRVRGSIRQVVGLLLGREVHEVGFHPDFEQPLDDLREGHLALLCCNRQIVNCLFAHLFSFTQLEVPAGRVPAQVSSLLQSAQHALPMRADERTPRRSGRPAPPVAESSAAQPPSAQ